MTAWLTAAQFRRGLHEEHLEEAAFLYTQRQARRDDAQMSWPRLAELDERIESHLDGLVIAGEEGAGVCAERSKRGDDAGEVFASLVVFCRQQRADLVSACAAHVDLDDAALSGAFADALKEELPVQWLPYLLRALERDVRWASVLAPVCAYRQLPAAAALTAVLPASRDPGPVIEAIGRLRDPRACTALRPYLQHHDNAVRSTTLLALAELGSSDDLRAHSSAARRERWPHSALALAGDASAVTIFEQIVSSGRADAKMVQWLGILGQGSSLKVLLDALAESRLGAAAAKSLRMITGLSPEEDVFVAEPADEALMSDDELDAWRRDGSVPLRSDGTPWGEATRQLSTDAAVWSAALVQAGTRLDASLRYRDGEPIDPLVLVHHLLQPQADDFMRRQCARELAVRYACELPFDTTMPVARQFEALRAIERWAQGHRGRFVPGAWYFAGHNQ